MSQKIENILKRINYIETDMDIQKQILFSIPSANKEEMTTVMEKIAAAKQQIDELRQEIKKIDPEEFNRIITFENAVTGFKKIAAQKKFKEITTLNPEQECSISLTDQTRIECLVKAEDENGHWTVVTLDGKIEQFSKNEVKS